MNIQCWIPGTQYNYGNVVKYQDLSWLLWRQAQHWRGVTAVINSSFVVKELPPTALSSYSNPHILPPAYNLHTTALTSNHLIMDLQIFHNTLILLLIWPPQCLCTSRHAKTLCPPFRPSIGCCLGYQVGWQSWTFSKVYCAMIPITSGLAYLPYVI